MFSAVGNVLLVQFVSDSRPLFTKSWFQNVPELFLHPILDHSLVAISFSKRGTNFIMSEPMMSRSWSGGSLVAGQSHLMDVDQKGWTMKEEMELEFQEGPHCKLYSGYV